MKVGINCRFWTTSVSGSLSLLMKLESDKLVVCGGSCSECDRCLRLRMQRFGEVLVCEAADWVVRFDGACGRVVAQC